MNKPCKDFCNAFSRKKTVPASIIETTLVRCLSTIDLTLVGVGSTLGSGIYVLVGDVARNKAGPAIVIAIFIAAFAAILSGLCYVEFAARVPKAGSAYVYCYVVIGELAAFIIGWTLLQEYIIGSAATGRAFSAYIDSLTGGYIQNKTISYIGEINTPGFSKYFDMFSFLILIFFSIIISLGMKNSARLNNICVAVNLITIGTVIIVGGVYSEPKNWGNFAPFGFDGIIAGSASCFLAFIGFEVIATTSEEARDPAKSIPFSIIGTIVICFMSYIGVGTVVTMMVPYTELNVNAAVAVVFDQRNVNIMGIIIAVGASAGLLGGAVASLLPPPRLLYALAQDGMVFSVFSRVNEKTGVPVIGTMTCGCLVALISALFDLSTLIEMLSIGTLMAYTAVVVCVLILRYRPTGYRKMRSIPSRHNSLEDDRFNRNSHEETSGQVTSNNFDDEESCISNGPISSNSTLFIDIIISLIVLEIAIVSFLVTKNYTKFSKDYKSIMADTAVFILTLLVVSKGIHLSSRNPTTNTQLLEFKVPLVPWIPILALFANISMMLHLSRITWYRFAVWFGIGVIFYAIYGIRHSKERITVTDSDDTEASAHGGSAK